LSNWHQLLDRALQGLAELELDDVDSRVQRAMKTDAPIGYGASGGGVFSVPSGKLVGLVEGVEQEQVTQVKNARSGFPEIEVASPPKRIGAASVEESSASVVLLGHDVGV